jgi:hypothetical protein
MQAWPFGREQRRLLVVISVAIRASAWARTAEFAAALAALNRIEAEREAAAITPRSVIPMPPPPEQTTDDVSVELTATERIDWPLPLARSAGDAVSVMATHSTPMPRQPIDMQQPGAASWEATPPIWLPASVPAPAEVLQAPGAAPHEKAEADMPVTTAVADVSDADSNRWLPVAELVMDEWPNTRAKRIETEFGGIFYLLNAAIAMGLYGDFTAPRAKNLALSPWDWLALIGRAWCPETFIADPVWKALADLAVRGPDEKPDRDSEMPNGWLDEHLDALNARLRSALGADESIDLSVIVCCHRAQVEVTPSRVDVHLALSDLPLDVRIAGLDRDPGWIPAAGRSVAFHFE